MIDCHGLGCLEPGAVEASCSRRHRGGAAGEGVKGHAAGSLGGRRIILVHRYVDRQRRTGAADACAGRGHLPHRRVAAGEGDRQRPLAADILPLLNGGAGKIQHPGLDVEVVIRRQRRGRGGQAIDLEDRLHHRDGSSGSREVDVADSQVGTPGRSPDPLDVEVTVALAAWYSHFDNRHASSGGRGRETGNRRIAALDLDFNGVGDCGTQIDGVLVLK